MYGSNKLQMYKNITTGEIINVLKCIHNSKTPEIDEIKNFWLHHRSSTRQRITTLISGIIKEPEKMSDDLTGIAYLPKNKHKIENNSNKKQTNYRPITYHVTS